MGTPTDARPTPTPGTQDPFAKDAAQQASEAAKNAVLKASADRQQSQPDPGHVNKFLDGLKGMLGLHGAAGIAANKAEGDESAAAAANRGVSEAPGDTTKY